MSTVFGPSSTPTPGSGSFSAKLRRSWKTVTIIVVVAMVAVSGLIYVVLHNSSGQTTTVAATATTSPTASPSTSPTTPSTADCATTWKMVSTTPSNGRWVTDGVPSIVPGATREQNLAAANTWLDGIKEQTGTLVGAASYLLHRTVDPATLYDARTNCANPAAVEIMQEMGAALSLADLAVSDVPATAYNSGTSQGVVYSATGPGIAGNRTALKVVLKDGTTVWIMQRCGNLATVEVPPAPPRLPPEVVVQPCAPVALPSIWYVYNDSTKCTYHKLSQSEFCQWNATDSSCPPNPSHEPANTLTPQQQKVIAQPSTVPSTAPAPLPKTTTTTPPATNTTHGSEPVVNPPLGAKTNDGTTTLGTSPTTATPTAVPTLGTLTAPGGTVVQPG